MSQKKEGKFMLPDSQTLPNDDSRDIQSQLKPHIKHAIHGKLYRWAGTQVRDKAVLDAGCGTGYGPAILAKTAQRVVAIDHDPQIIAGANAAFARPNVEFMVMDCESMAFDADSFDVVVCSALLEYLRDVPAFIAEVHRVLKANGLFICGTKNLQLSLKNADGTPRYRNHRQEFDPDGLKGLLAGYFSDIEISGERMKTRSEAYIMNEPALKIEDFLVRLGVKKLFPRTVRDRVRALITGVELGEISHDDFEITEGLAHDALYIVGLGVKANH